MRAPRFARVLVRLASPARQRDDLLGDLEESYRRRRTRGGVSAWVGTCLEAVVIARALVAARARGWTRSRSGALVHATDARLGLRLMLRQPVLTLTALVSLTVGIALATVGFAFMDVVLFSRLPFDGGDRFVLVQAFDGPERTPARLTADGARTLVARATTFDYIGGVSGSRENVRLPSGDVRIATTAGITPRALQYLPYTPVQGRLLTESDGAAGAPAVCMIRAAFRDRTFGSGDAALRATIRVGDVTRTIVGVVPDAFEFPNTPDIWLPIDEGFRTGRSRPESGTRLFGVLAPGRSLAMAQDQLGAIAPSLATDDPAGGGVRFEVTTFTDLGPQGAALATMVIGMVVAVLLVIAANVGNLILVRSFGRSREFALRSALGASRRRLIAQVFVEVLLVAGIAAVIGGFAAAAALRQFNTMDELPFWVDFTGGLTTKLFVVGATLAATLVAGVWPALRATRRDLAAHLQGGGGRASDMRFGRAAAVMVVVQIALSIVMLHGAAIFRQGFADYTGQALPLPANVLTTNLSIDAIKPASGSGRRIALTADDVESAVRALPGVIAAGLATALPRHSPPAARVEVDASRGEPAPATRLAPSVEVSSGFFGALDARPLAGRLLVAADSAPNAAPVAVVNESFVQKFFHGASPVGRRLRVESGSASWREVVGVVPDLGISVGDPSLAAGYYVPLGPDTHVVYLAMRVTGDPLEYAAPLRRTLLALDPQTVLNRVERLEDVGTDDRVAFKWFSVALAGIGAVTLVLALAGVYAMMALAVARRTREIGIRVALGASTARILRSIVGRAAWQVACGGVTGVALAVASLGMRGMFASRLGDGGPWTLPLVVILLVAAGLAATGAPLRRALRVRPADALRAE